ncbi:hypothetical protein RFI_17131 [Reticulomyxa filosa]|uniref:Uncharacterized protein n=1 Tax=Reticulomyxa filosa TaxID=46433 RepID=X6N2F0_RETFI|nr:hypothetical protein RFI_17131 [Reticulomyxa filosa]|eukprot:ETO20088.1 hypothetical protein RFI_17131 [Reticulomyxa filosa]
MHFKNSTNKKIAILDLFADLYDTRKKSKFQTKEEKVLVLHYYFLRSWIRFLIVLANKSNFVLSLKKKKCINEQIQTTRTHPQQTKKKRKESLVELSVVESVSSEKEEKQLEDNAPDTVAGQAELTSDVYFGGALISNEDDIALAYTESKCEVTTEAIENPPFKSDNGSTRYDTDAPDSNVYDASRVPVLAKENIDKDLSREHLVLSNSKQAVVSMKNEHDHDDDHSIAGEDSTKTNDMNMMPCFDIDIDYNDSATKIVCHGAMGQLAKDSWIAPQLVDTSSPAPTQCKVRRSKDTCTEPRAQRQRPDDESRSRSRTQTQWKLFQFKALLVKMFNRLVHEYVYKESEVIEDDEKKKYWMVEIICVIAKDVTDVAAAQNVNGNVNVIETHDMADGRQQHRWQYKYEQLHFNGSPALNYFAVYAMLESIVLRNYSKVTMTLLLPLQKFCT